jgi:hypothetical protein
MVLTNKTNIARASCQSLYPLGDHRGHVVPDTPKRQHGRARISPLGVDVASITNYGVHYVFSLAVLPILCRHSTLPEKPSTLCMGIVELVCVGVCSYPGPA